MFGTRRLAKRSIVGTRIAAKWQDGRFYPGVIQSQYADETPFTEAVYTILFEDGFQKNITAKNIIGQGFQSSIPSVLKNGQKVFLTLNGREVDGLVINHDVDTYEVLINVKLNNGSETEVTKRLEEVRLMKSRKSARLLDQDTDYSKLADLQLSESKKRTVSSGIDMPAKQSRHWQSKTDTVTEDVDVSEEEEIEMMDENIAAMVLTSLSCSPQSPQSPQYNDLRELHTYNKPSQLSTSASSSGFYSNQSERSDPSPPATSHLSESAPTASGMMFGPFLQDDGVDSEEDGSKENEVVGNRKKTMYQCTWPKCDKISSTLRAIEHHIKEAHLGIRILEERDDSGSDSDSEVDFYYTEIEVNVENVTQGFSDLTCVSQVSPSHHQVSPSHHVNNVTVPQTFVIPDHDYQKKEFRQVLASSVPSTSAFLNHSNTQPMAIPIKVPEFQRSLSWQNTYTFSSSPSPPIRTGNKLSSQERLAQHQAQSPKLHNQVAPPKLMSIHKKPRSEVRKCRKVYGMENRDMWCTQCKWKKACTRFLE